MTTMQMFQIVGGLCVFLYGISQVTRNLQKLAGPTLRMWVARLTKNPLLGFLMGIFLAFALQSSGAVALMLIGFANAGLVSLAQALPVILGAGIGSSLTVQLLAFKIYKFAPILITIGFVIFFFVHSRVWHYTGRVIFSFGLLFLGMAIMKDGIVQFHEHPAIGAMVDFLVGAPFWVAVFGFALATLFQSSTAVLGLLLTLAFSGIVDLRIALPMIIGANVGSCMLGIIGSIKGKTISKRIAFGQLILRIVIAVIFFAFIGQYRSIIDAIGGDLPRRIANAHTFFETVVALIFFPFAKVLARFFEKIIPQGRSDVDFSPRYLDDEMLANPLVAMGQATKEIIRMGEKVEEMLRDWGKVFFSNDKQLLKKIIDEDDKVDLLQESITEFLSKVAMEEMEEESASLTVALVHIAFELEHIGDVISKDLAVHAQKKIDVGYYFSDEGFSEILQYHDDVLKNYRTALDAIPLRDKTLAKMVIEQTKHLVERQRELYRSHLVRLRKGLKESEETSTIHIDILSDLNNINLHISYIAYAIMGKI